MENNNEQLIYRCDGKVRHKKKSRVWMIDTLARRRHLYDLMESIYSYIKTLGYDLLDIRTLEEFRAVMSIDSLRRVANKAGFKDELAERERIKGKKRKQRRTRRIRDRMKSKMKIRRRWVGAYGYEMYADVNKEQQDNINQNG